MDDLAHPPAPTPAPHLPPPRGFWQRIGDRLAALIGRPRAVVPPERSVAFTIAVIALGAKLAKADGRVAREEVAAFRRIFKIPRTEERHAAHVFDLARRDVAGFDLWARRIASMFPPADPVQLGEQAAHGQVLPTQRLGELLLAPLERLLATLLREPLADLVARPRGLHEAEPVPAGAGVGGLRGEDLHDVAVLGLDQPGFHRLDQVAEPTCLAGQQLAGLLARLGGDARLAALMAGPGPM